MPGSTKKAVTNGAIFVGYNIGNIAVSVGWSARPHSP